MDTNELKSKLFQFGSDMKDSAGRLTKNAVDSSRKVTEKVRIQNTIRKAENQLKETYTAIGQKYEEIYGTNNDPEFSVYMQQIAQIKAQIAAAQAEASSLNTASVCPKCNKYVAEGQAFCSNCGTKINTTESVIDGEIIP